MHAFTLSLLAPFSPPPTPLPPTLLAFAKSQNIKFERNASPSVLPPRISPHSPVAPPSPHSLIIPCSASPHHPHFAHASPLALILFLPPLIPFLPCVDSFSPLRSSLSPSAFIPPTFIAHLPRPRCSSPGTYPSFPCSHHPPRALPSSPLRSCLLSLLHSSLSPSLIPSPCAHPSLPLQHSRLVPLALPSALLPFSLSPLIPLAFPSAPLCVSLVSPAPVLPPAPIPHSPCAHPFRVRSSLIPPFPHLPPALIPHFPCAIPRFPNATFSPCSPAEITP
ncbi:unnamed protein product [Closterium sp. Naga37s-1]|nr:unnamed protein product [Closterium sp. Naga37s-1]